MYHSNPESGQNISKCELKVDNQAVPIFKKWPTTGQSASEKTTKTTRITMAKTRYSAQEISFMTTTHLVCVTERILRMSPRKALSHE